MAHIYDLLIVLKIVLKIFNLMAHIYELLSIFETISNCGVQLKHGFSNAVPLLDGF